MKSALWAQLLFCLSIKHFVRCAGHLSELHAFQQADELRELLSQACVQIPLKLVGAPPKHPPATVSRRLVVYLLIRSIFAASLTRLHYLTFKQSTH